MGLAVFLFLLSAVSPTLVLLLVALKAWREHDRRLVSERRQNLFLGGLIATTASVMFFVAFTLESPTHEHYFLCLRGGFWTGLAGLVFCCFGSGRSRLFGAASAGIIWALWLMLCATPP